jgi:hypothetical protein
MLTDMQGIALVITAVGSAVSSILSAQAKRSSEKAAEAAEKSQVNSRAALSSIKEVQIEFNGHMEKFLAVKDELTEVRVDGSYKQGLLDQKEKDGNSTSTK